MERNLTTEPIHYMDVRVMTGAASVLPHSVAPVERRKQMVSGQWRQSYFVTTIDIGLTLLQTFTLPSLNQGQDEVVMLKTVLRWISNCWPTHLHAVNPSKVHRIFCR